MIARTLLAAALTVFLAVPALAFHCPVDMKKIDAALAENPKLDAAEMTKVKTLRGTGEALHKAGDHAESVKALGKAMAILGIK